MGSIRSPGTKALREFLSEAQDIVETLSRDLLDLEKSSEGGRVDPDLLNDAFRAAHTLKGMSGMFGVEPMSRLAHRMEDGLDALRMGRRSLDASIVNPLFEGIELLGAMLRRVGEKGVEEEAQWQEGHLAAPLESLIKGLAAAVLDPAPKEQAVDLLDSLELQPGIRQVLTEYEEHRLRENLKAGVNLYRVIASFDLMTFDKDLSELSASLKTLGEVISTLPSGEAGSDTKIDFELILGTENSLEAVIAAAGALGTEVIPLRRRNLGAGVSAGDSPALDPRGPLAERSLAVGTTQVGPLAITSSAEDPGAQRAAAAIATTLAPEAIGSLRSVSRTVRVDIGRLDALMTIVGELSLVKTNLQRMSAQLKAEAIDPTLSSAIRKELSSLDRRLEELQNGVLDVRMVPLSSLFDKLSRLARKTAQEVGKKVHFTATGGETELDKLIIEDLSDPLLHLIRNAIDHGIESRAERRRVNKPEEGEVALRAFQEGNHVVIEVRDDGAGMNEAAIIDTALRRQLISPTEIHELSTRDIFGLLFLPGFSTRDGVTDLSGRGVGLDVVKTNVAALSGVIDIDSSSGKGSRFTMTLPITLAILQALIVEAGDQVFALPLSGVLEILRLGSEKLRRVQGRPVIDLRGATLPLVRLATLFGLAEEELPPGRFYVAIVGLAQNRIAVALDGLRGQQDVVIKSLGERLGEVQGIAGATDLGDQRTTLVIDVAGLIEEVLEGRSTRMVG